MQIKFSNHAMKQIKVLDKPTKQRIKAGIDNLPLGDVKRLQGYQRTFRLRVGTYRVIYEYDGETITIKLVLPRGEVYKNL